MRLRPSPPPVPRRTALPLAGSLAVHGLAAATMAGLGWWWLREPEPWAEPPEMAVMPQEQTPAVEEPPAPRFDVVQEEPPEPEVVEAPLEPWETLAEVEVLLPRPPEPPFPDSAWEHAPAPPKEPVTEPAEPPAEPETAPPAAEEDRAAVEPPQVDAAHCPPPVYPRAARRLGQQGVVEVLVTVGADGAPTAVAVHKSSGYPLLDEAARDAVEGWRFHAARRADGSAVAGELVVPVRFRLGGD